MRVPAWPGRAVWPDESGNMKRGLREETLDIFLWEQPPKETGDLRDILGTARSFPSILPFLIFFKIRQVGKFCNALRKTFKLVEKSHSIGLFKSIALWGWCHGQGGETHYEMMLLGFSAKPTLPCGNPPEALSNAWEPSGHGSFQSDTWKKNHHRSSKSSWLTPYC